MGKTDKAFIRGAQIGAEPALRQLRRLKARMLFLKQNTPVDAFYVVDGEYFDMQEAHQDIIDNIESFLEEFDVVPEESIEDYRQEAGLAGINIHRFLRQDYDDDYDGRSSMNLHRFIE